MTITISQQTFHELLYQETENSSQYPDPDDQLDVIYDYPKLLGQGYWWEIKLRPGLELAIGDLRLGDRVIFEDPENAKAIKLSAAFVPVIRMLVLVGFTALLFMGGMAAYSGRISIGNYSVLLVLVQRLLWPLVFLGETFTPRL